MRRLSVKVHLTEGKYFFKQLPSCKPIGAHLVHRGETEDLSRFNFDFNFPSPPPPSEGDQDEQLDDNEGFELPAMDLQSETGPIPEDGMDIGGGFDDDDNAGGGFGLELNIPHQASPESPGIAGGGLRDEDHIAADPKQKRYSRHGIPVPKMPSGVVKKLATQFARGRAGSKAKINKQTMSTIEQASSWYFEQVGEDLAAYSKHAGRKTIDESDVTTLMRR
jgi:histone H3/H4